MTQQNLHRTYKQADPLAIAARIASIIGQRRHLADNIAEAEKKLKFLASALSQLETDRQQLLMEVDASDIIQRLNVIDFLTIQPSIATELEVLGKLRVRFSRNTLNIGVVGRMKQGKSTLLQSVSGLSNDEIPTRQGKACTAVHSTIYHRSGNQTEALVTFHTENSFLKEVILPYFDELQDLLDRKPTSLDDFKNMQLEKPHSSSSATNNTIYQRLHDDYYLNLETYRPLLGKEPERITKEKIREYVAQHEENGKLKDCKHLAVQKVEIYCTFPKSDDVGQIALIDIPGLGDFKLGDEQLMLKALEQEVDIVLFVHKPNEDGYGWQTEDTKLYDKACGALYDLPARSFMVLNNKVNADETLRAVRISRLTLTRSV